MATYDPKIIQAFAEDLYSRAATIVLTNVLFFSILGGIAGFFMFQGAGAAVLLIVGGALGYYFGSQRAFLLKLQAQTALCQIEIERNTRAVSPVSAGAKGASVPTPALYSPRQIAVSTCEEEKGKCPNCTRTIPLASEECPRCKAVFTEGSAWKVQPL
jgi:hypothetical protein